MPYPALDLPPPGLEPGTVISLAFGGDPREAPDLNTIITRIATALEIPPLAIECALEDLKALLSSADALNTDDEIFKADQLVAKLMSGLDAFFSELAKHRSEDTEKAIGELLMRYIQIDNPVDLMVVVAYLFREVDPLRLVFRAMDRDLRARAYGFVRAMLAADASAALGTWLDSERLVAPPEVTVRPMMGPYNMYLDAETSFEGSPPKAIRLMLQAWHDAFETPLMRVFFHIEDFGRARGLVTEKRQTDASGNIRKGKVLPNARTVCAAIGAPFPAHDRIGEIRNAIGHTRDYVILDGRVRFQSRTGPFELSFDEIRKGVRDDTVIALLIDHLYKRHTPEFIPVADAWARLKAQLPALQEAALAIEQRRSSKKAIVMSKKYPLAPEENETT